MTLVSIFVCLVMLYMSTCIAQCPETWMMFQDYCLIFDRERKTWSDAEQTCHNFYGHLAAPSTAIRDINLKAFLRLHNYKEPVWVDATDQFKNGFWFWASTREEMTFSKWLPGEPNFLTSQQCVALIDGDDNWRNRECSDENAFVCEIKADPVHGAIVG